MDMIRIAILGFCGMLLGLLVKETKPEYTVYISLACAICILAAMTPRIEYMIQSVRSIQSGLPVDTSYINLLFKLVGITYIGHFSSAICKDAGFSSIAMQIDTFCKMAVMAMSMPVLLTLLRVIQEVLK